jgi:hypothetical protein
VDSRLNLARHHDEIWDWAGHQVRDLVLRHHYDHDDWILDVGADQGKYRLLLWDYPNVDGNEVYEPSVVENDLTSLYRDVILGDIYDVVTYDDFFEQRPYDVAILGDVLEHMTVTRAQYVLDRLVEHVDDVIVVVPFLYEQGPEGDNHYQVHLQDDLTPELMYERYPALSLVAIESRESVPFKGVYRWRS